MTFRLCIPGRDIETATAANPANPLIRIDAADDAVPPEVISFQPISRLAALAEPAGFNRDAQVVRTAPAPTRLQRCSGCRSRGRFGTCVTPVEAGLVERFEIQWPPDGHGATCAAWAPNEQPAHRDQEPPQLSRDDADWCHAGGWDDAEIRAFMERRNRLMRWGYSEQEADDLAERLTLRDGESDARVICVDCAHYRPGRCGNHRLARLNVAEVGRDLAATLQHCSGFGSKGS